MIPCKICKKNIIGSVELHMKTFHKGIKWCVDEDDEKETKETKEAQDNFEQNSVKKRLYGTTSDFLSNLSADFLRLREIMDADDLLMEQKLKLAHRTKRNLAVVCKLGPQFLNKMIKGPCQGRKTWAMCCISLYQLIRYKMTTILIVEESLDSRYQIVSRFEKAFDKYKKHLEEQGIKLPFKEEYFRVLESKNVSKQELQEAMTDKKPKIIVVLRSKSNMNHITETIAKSANKRFVLILDESDANDTASDCKAQDCLEKLKDNASSIFNVSATPMTTLCKNDILQQNTIIMSIPENYKGMEMIKIKQLPQAAFSCNSTDDDPFEKDKNLMSFLRQFSTKPIFRDINLKYHCNMPPICLIRPGKTIDPQIKIAETVEKEFLGEITTITYNKDITIRGKSLPKSPIELIRNGGKSVYTKYKDGVHKVKNIHIGAILTFLQNEGIQKHKRILIIAGDKACRGITFCSDAYEEFIAKKQIPWHLCMMYFIAPDGTSQPNLLQYSGRLCGIYPDNIPLILYTNAKKDLVKAFRAQEELIKRAKEKELDTLTFMRKSISMVEISREKISKRAIVASGVVCSLKKVDDDSEFGGENWLQNLEEKKESKEEKTEHTLAVVGNIYTIDPENVPHKWVAIVSDIIDKIDEADTWVDRSDIVNKLWRTKKYPSLPGLRGTLTHIQQSVKDVALHIGRGLNFRKKANSTEIELLYHV